MGESHPTADKPRLAWFTPFARSSAIGACSKRAVESLRADFDVDVWHPDLGDAIETDVPCRPFDAKSGVEAPALEGYDHVLYNFGNNPQFHVGIWRTAQRRPGAVILHDAVMFHFFDGLYLMEQRHPEGMAELLFKHYGAGARTYFSRSLEGLEAPIPDTARVSEWSLIEPAVESAYGVLVHSEYLRSKIADFAECPVVTANLPVERSAAQVSVGRAQLGVPGDRVLIVVAGALNRNKRAESVIRALGSLPRQSKLATLALVGPTPPEEEARLRAIAQAANIESFVMTGAVSDAVFYSFLAEADICVNLRYPNTEGASASAIEEMLFDNAVVALDTGAFRELPGSVLARVRLSYEHQDLVHALDELIRTPARRRELAQRARAYAEKTYRPALYAQRVRELLQVTSRAAPLLRLADRVSRLYAQIGCTPGSPPLRRVIECMDGAFLGEPAGAPPMTGEARQNDYAPSDSICPPPTTPT